MMSYFIDFFVCIYFVMAISATGTTAIEAIVALIITILIIIKKKGIISISHKPLKWLILFLCGVTIEIIISGNIPITYVLNRYSMFLPIVLFSYYKDNFNRKRMLNLSLLIFTMVSVYAIYLMGTGKMDARYLAAHEQTSIPFSGGGYALAVAAALLAVFLLDDYLWKDNRNLFSIFFVVLFGVVVILTQSTTTIIVMFLGIISSLLLYIFSVSSFININKRQALGIMALGVVCILLMAMKGIIGNFIIDLSIKGTGILSRRLAEFGYLLSGGSGITVNTSDSADRMSRLINSALTFLKHPIFGVTSVVGTDHFLQVEYGVGSHGEFLDSLARFGLLAGVPFISIFMSGIIAERKSQKQKIGLGYVITFAGLFALNPCLYASLNCVLFFIIPMITLERWRSKRPEMEN